ncbi:radical SAM protein [Fusobacterium massiliense]|uniref:radical SAM protein n=1 Tax=Fusobacterium massiliense TaxID=1852365 RepID=UPI00093FE521|nr:radical SAM protein [Fusobacterium massiliense]
MGVRYNRVEGKFAREITLLKSFPCVYGKCKFCNYIEDNSTNESEINSVNFEVLKEVSGDLGVLEVINSGSVFELPRKTLEKIREIVYEKDIKILYFEIFYFYLPRLNEIVDFFNEKKKVEIRFRTGIESFDNDYRRNVYGKNIILDEKKIKELSEKIYSVCLLIATKGQTQEMIRKDIEIGLKYFKAITVNVFDDNGTEVKSDPELVRWFEIEMRDLFDNDRVEILMNNRELGVFEQ